MRMVATDLDGTIVRPDGTISSRTVAAFDACERAGVNVVFVTGRPPRWMHDVVEQTGHRGLALCANGALVYDLANEQAVRSHTISRADVLEARRRLLDELLGDRQGDIGFEEGDAHFAHGGAHFEFVQGAAATQLVEDAGQAFGQAFEHQRFLILGRRGRAAQQPLRRRANPR